jgi:hypothetical protein
MLTAFGVYYVVIVVPGVLGTLRIANGVLDLYVRVKAIRRGHLSSLSGPDRLEP